ncbi:hypothetical protein FLAG1_11909 [Fusarium langsethiae]|uniref:Uncharacterized protein n=1 Tax=Fusarium langsethiae TaxID=179993 RepID=A0A0M9ELV6_FUSLA|nr:hypothetical protein FLAG1_11909 [Fusarium langsethiae]
MALAMGECGIDDDRISGLHIPLTIHDLRQGRKYFNNLSDENENQDREKHLEFLCCLLVKFNVHDKFGIVDPHEHFELPPGYHLVANFGVEQGAPVSLIEVVEDETFHPDKLCGHKFVFISGKLRPYQFRSGPLLDTSAVDSRLFSELIEYFNEHKITSLGLEYTEPQVSGIRMYETVLKQERRMILRTITPSLMLSNDLKWVPTCWRCSSNSNPIPDPQDWCGKDKDTGKHKDPEDFQVDTYLTSIQMDFTKGSSTLSSSFVNSSPFGFSRKKVNSVSSSSG